MSEEDFRKLLEDLCRKHLVRIEVYAAMGQGTIEFKFVSDEKRAGLAIESEE